MLYQLYKALERPNASKYGKVVQRLILANILVNISVSLLLVFLVDDPDVKRFLINVEYVTVACFCIELAMRYIVIGFDSRFQGLSGRLRYTFTPFILIDIFSLVPYFLTGIRVDGLLGRLVRFLRFFRVLKLLRLNNTIKQLFSLSFFATAPIAMQLLILLLISCVFIAIFSFFLQDIKLSVMLFLAPDAISEVHSHKQAIIGLLELILGLIVGSTLISIISSLLTNVIDSIHGGYYPYRGKDHIIIINTNIKIDFILDEIDCYHFAREQSTDVVLFLPFVDDILNFTNDLKSYSNTRVRVVKGNPYIWRTYKKLCLNTCKKVIILDGDGAPTVYADNKIARFILTSSEFTNVSVDFIIETNAKQNENFYSEIFSQSDNHYDIINSEKIIQSLLNRAIVNPSYFDIYANVLSFKDWKLIHMKVSNFSQHSLTFEMTYKQLKDGLPLGIVRQGQLLLNPEKTLSLLPSDILITLVKDSYGHYLAHNVRSTAPSIALPVPQRKIHKRICVVGDFDKIHLDNIDEFLAQKSVESLKVYSKYKDEEYLLASFWEPIIKENFDMVILNLNDDFEFILSMYLRDTYQDNIDFLKSIINVVHDPMYEQLLKNERFKHNVVISDKIIAAYIVQIVMNPYIIEIFNEITSSTGNEFYTLNKRNYPLLFRLDIFNVKAQLLDNRMIYVGAMINGRFEVNSERVSNFEEIVVLANGVQDTEEQA